MTFLFTDVEGSTRRWEADAQAMRVALAVHDKVLRSAIETHGGFMFKHTGDGVCAAFASPRSAVDAAVAAQRALELPVADRAGDPHSRVVPQLPVRVQDSTGLVDPLVIPGELPGQSLRGKYR